MGDVISPTPPAGSSAGYSGYSGLDSGLDSLAAQANHKVGHMGYQDSAPAPAAAKYVARLPALHPALRLSRIVKRWYPWRKHTSGAVSVSPPLPRWQTELCQPRHLLKGGAEVTLCETNKNANWRFSLFSWA
jgi:hypothetical protein